MCLVGYLGKTMLNAPFVILNSFAEQPQSCSRIENDEWSIEHGVSSWLQHESPNPLVR